MLGQIVLFSPLLAALIVGFFGRSLGVILSNIITVLGVAASCVASWMLFLSIAIGGGAAETHTLLEWIAVGGLQLNWAIHLDALSTVMLVVVTTVSTCVHVYSIGYMSHDKARQRFMAYLSLFTFAMLMLVTADNLVQLFFGWEGVGLASYLLIGFWNERASANAASIKAFVVNRVGDLGLALGIFAAYALFGTVTFDGMFDAAAARAGDTLDFWGYSVHGLTLVCILLFIGACGKSAQLGLHTWLPDAMEGPTPVSALIHAATMVTAGVFLLCRISPLLEYAPLARDVVMLVGALTAIFAASIGLTQFDIKRVIAYSTCSQLGYMMFAAGASAYGAAMFHLFTHAFFKALLFLGAGSVIHGLHDEQDMRKMGGIRAYLPVTFALMWIGSLALAGIPLFAGFYSKDIVLESAFASGATFGILAYSLGVMAALLTAFYSWRLLILTFDGKHRGDHHVIEHAHESPVVMLVPLFVLAAGALVAGYIGYPYFVGDLREAFWNGSIFVLHENDSVHKAHDVALWVKKLPLVMAVSGIALAYVFYRFYPVLPARVAAKAGGLYRFLFNKWYWDELYARVFIRPSFAAGLAFWQRGDVGIIDRFGPDGVAALSGRASSALKRFQSGYMYHYAFAMFIGVTAAVTWFIMGGGQ